jgi:hypothetical protein
MSKININGVTITLTPEQLEEINKQQNKKITSFYDIKSYKDACEVLNIPQTNYLRFPNEFEWNIHIIRTVGRAINSLIEIETKNTKFPDLFPDFKNIDQKKYYPYFCYKEENWLVYSGSAYVIVSSRYCGHVAFFKTEEASVYAGNQFVSIYKLIAENY